MLTGLLVLTTFFPFLRRKTNNWHIAFFCLVLCSIFISDYILDYDAYLYHLQAIRWAKEGFLHLGTANIHSRLGFQSLWFDLHALFDFSGVFGYPLPLLNGLVALASLLYLSKKALEQKKQWFAYALLFMVVVFSTLDGPLYYLLRGYNPDIPAAFLTFAYFYYAYKNKELSFKVVKNLTIISLFAVLIKLSTIPLLIYSVILILYKIGSKEQVKSLIYLLEIVAIVIGYYSIKNIFLTGYIVFPVAVTKLPVLWAVPQAEVAHLSGIISSWAKVRAVNPELYSPLNLSWIPTWYSQQTMQSLVTIFGGFFSILGIGLLAILEKNKRLFAIFTGIAGLITYWFLMAPDIRFGLGIVFISVFILVSELLKLNHKIVAYVLGTLFLVLLIRSVPPITNYYHWFRMVPKVRPAGLQNFETKVTEVNGYTYFIPKNVGTDQANYADFPSAPFIDPCLQQRKTGPFIIHYKECN